MEELLPSMVTVTMVAAIEALQVFLEEVHSLQAAIIKEHPWQEVAIELQASKLCC